jgi:hypothetical protein
LSERQSSEQQRENETQKHPPLLPAARGCHGPCRKIAKNSNDLVVPEVRKGNYTVRVLTSKSLPCRDMRANSVVFLPRSCHYQRPAPPIGKVNVGSTVSMGFQ